MDAVPGMVTGIHFTPTATTQEMRVYLNDPYFNYEVACAELCGRMHFAMKLILVVDEPEEFDRWYNDQKSWVSRNPEDKTVIYKSSVDE
jgi:cytochrome c oxidase subunit 2